MSDNSKVNKMATNGNVAGRVEMKDSTTNKIITDVKSEADVGEIEILTRAGVETKIENYGNKDTHRRHFLEADDDEVRDVTQRRHFFEADDDEVRDVTNKETAAGSEGKVKIDEVEVTEKEKAALIEKGLVEDCEGILSQRRHFPGTTTSNIFAQHA